MRRADSLLHSCAVAGVLLAFAGVGNAHESWLLATNSISADGSLSLRLTSGMAFPADDHAIEPARVQNARWRQGKAHGEVSVGERGEHALALGAKLPAARTTTVALELPAHALEIDAENVEEYLEDLGNPAAVRERWKSRGTWRERYRKSLKAVVLAGAEGDDARAPMGLPLELVPVSDPRTIAAGDAFELQLLANGKPLADVRVGLDVPGSEPRFVVSDSAGKVGFASMPAGPALFHAIELRPVNAVDLDWESDFTTLTLEVPHAASR